MKRLWLILPLLCLLFPVRVFAQYTVITATPIKDVNGTAYVNCTATASFINQNTTSGAPQPLLNGSTFQTEVVGVKCDSAGNLTMRLADNQVVYPGPSQWKFSICSAPYTGQEYSPTTTYCFPCQTTITGDTQDLTSVLQACSVPLPNNGCSGGSSVVSFTAGNLAPLFTTSVTNPTTTPDLEFSLTSAPAYTLFGNPTGSSAAPTFFNTTLPQTLTSTSHNFVNSYSALTGLFGTARPSCSDLSDAGPGCSGSLTSGITSINTDTHAAQTITSADNSVTITNNGSGGHDLRVAGMGGGKFVAWNTSGTCSTGSTDYYVCTGTFTVPSVSFSNTSWVITCSGGAQTGHPAIQFLVPVSGTQFTYGITNGTNSGAMVSSFATLHCMAWGT